MVSKVSHLSTFERSLLDMEISILLVWICFLFCLGLSAGGILVLFKNREFKEISSFKFLQYAMILLYTFGFYSLWSKVFFSIIFNPTQSKDLKALSDFIAFIGTPFLLIGMCMLFVWSYNLLKEAPKKRLIGSSIGFTILFELIFLYINRNDLFQNVHQLYSFLVLLFAIPVIVILSFSELNYVLGKSKWVTILVIISFTVVHLPVLLSNIRNYYFEIVFNFLFFLNITLLEVYFLYNAHWQIHSAKKDFSDKNGSFELFIHKYAITSRESEVIKELYAGKTDKEIAENLFISLQTVKDHNHRIYQKTNVRSRSQLASLLRNYEVDL